MKKYVLIARHLGIVSGEKIYHHNKIRYLLKSGWEVFFFSGKPETVPLENSNDYYHYVYPALAYAPECYSKREVDKTISSIISDIKKAPEDICIIESDQLNRSLWAELIAHAIGAKHLALLLQESHNYDEAARDFLRFKYNRHELAGITEVSIRQMLKDNDIELRDDTKISAYCNNVVEKCEDVFSRRLKKKAALTFGSLGRLDKGCVIPILEGFIAYASARPNEYFNLVLIGDSMGKKRKKLIIKRLKECKNVNLIITGFLYPIPESLINNIDLFVSTAGSSNVTYRYHRPTIKVQPLTGEVVGVLGLDDFDGKSMYDVFSNISVEDAINKTLLNKEKITYTYNFYEDYYKIMYAEFERQLSFGDSMKEKEYYNDQKTKRIRTHFIKSNLGHRIIGRIFGAKALNTVIYLVKLLKKERG